MSFTPAPGAAYRYSWWKADPERPHLPVCYYASGCRIRNDFPAGTGLYGAVSRNDTGKVCSLTARLQFIQHFLADNFLRLHPDCQESTIWHSLELAQLADFVRQLPQQLDTPLSAWMPASSPEVSAAGCSLHSARPASLILLLDEPTAGLSQETAWAMMTGIIQELDSVEEPAYYYHRPAVCRSICPGHLAFLTYSSVANWRIRCSLQFCPHISQ